MEDFQRTTLNDVLSQKIHTTNTPKQMQKFRRRHLEAITNSEGETETEASSSPSQV